MPCCGAGWPIGDDGGDAPRLSAQHRPEETFLFARQDYDTLSHSMLLGPDLGLTGRVDTLAAASTIALEPAIMRIGGDR